MGGITKSTFSERKYALMRLLDDPNGLESIRSRWGMVGEENEIIPAPSYCSAISSARCLVRTSSSGVDDAVGSGIGL